jgi:hypothetical protein
VAVDEGQVVKGQLIQIRNSNVKPRCFGCKKQWFQQRKLKWIVLVDRNIISNVQLATAK